MSDPVQTHVAGRLLTLTNLDKVLYPATGYSKAEVIAYYAGIAEVMLPHLRDRALTRVRFPGGVEHASFYEKNAPLGTPDWVPTATVLSSDGPVRYVVAQEPATLVWLANLAALELHAPQWQLSSAEVVDGVVALPGPDPRPGEPLADRVVVDLDPGAGMTILDVARAALITAAELAGDGLLPVAQTSGSKGIQLYAAVAPCRCRDAWAYVKQLGVRLQRAHPDVFVATMSIEQRAGRIYVDYNQDLAARNTIAPYSMRGRERPSVATPVTFEELGSVNASDHLRFTPEEVLERVASLGDLAADLLIEDRPPLPPPLD